MLISLARLCHWMDALQSTVEGVEALLKRQEEVENRLTAQEERMKALGDTADRLMAGQHPDSQA